MTAKEADVGDRATWETVRRGRACRPGTGGLKEGIESGVPHRALSDPLQPPRLCPPGTPSSFLNLKGEKDLLPLLRRTLRRMPRCFLRYRGAKMVL